MQVVIAAEIELIPGGLANTRIIIIITVQIIILVTKDLTKVKKAPFAT